MTKGKKCKRFGCSRKAAYGVAYETLANIHPKVRGLCIYHILRLKEIKPDIRLDGK